MNEDKIDRRAHWVQALVTGLILATAWCVKLQMNVAQLETDFKDYKKEQKQNIKGFDDRLDDHNNRLIHLEDWREMLKVSR